MIPLIARFFFDYLDLIHAPHQPSLPGVLKSPCSFIGCQFVVFLCVLSSQHFLRASSVYRGLFCPTVFWTSSVNWILDICFSPLWTSDVWYFHVLCCELCSKGFLCLLYLLVPSFVAVWHALRSSTWCLLTCCRCFSPSSLPVSGLLHMWLCIFLVLFALGFTCLWLGPSASAESLHWTSAHSVCICVQTRFRASGTNCNTFP